MNIKDIIAHLLENDADRLVLADAYAAIEPEINEEDSADEALKSMLAFAAGYMK